jgi:hypothetical protein
MSSASAVLTSPSVERVRRVDTDRLTYADLVRATGATQAELAA